MRPQVIRLPLLVGLLALLVGAAIGNSHGVSTQRSVDAAVPPPTPIVRVVTRTRIVPHTVVHVRTVVHVHTVVRTVTRTRVVTHVVIHVVTRTVKVPVIVYRTHVVTRTVVKIVQVAAPTVVPVPSATAIPAPSATPDTSSSTSAASSGSNSAPNTYNGVVVTATNFHADSGGDFGGPPTGQTYAVVHVSLTNNGSSDADYNEMTFALQGANDHVKYDGGAFDTNISNTTLGSGKIAPGQTIAGDLAFQVPDNGQKYGLFWTPDFLGDSIPVDLK